MNQRGILSHVQKVFFIPQKSIRWIYVWTKLKCWFVLKHFTPPSFPIHTLNKWRKNASWVIVQFTTPRPYKIKRLAYRESLHVASVFKFTLLDPTKKIVEHFGILPTPWPYKSIHSTYGSSWHVDSFYWIYLPCPLQNILFNVWISMASWLMLKCSLPSPTTKPYIEHMKKGILSHFWNLQPIDPTKQHVEHMERFRMSSDAWDFRPFDPAGQMV